MKRPTKAELSNRVSQISGLLLRGYSRETILQYVSEKTDWGVSVRTVDNYISKATSVIKAGAETDIAYEIGKAKERSEYLWQKAIMMQDYKEARAVQKDRRDLLGLDASKNIQLSGPGGKAIEVIHVRPQEAEEDD